MTSGISRETLAAATRAWSPTTPWRSGSPAVKPPRCERWRPVKAFKRASA
jgi:hypothetical protein